jgi:DNA-binding MurR/RpiR family transcriptional regulator
MRDFILDLKRNISQLPKKQAALAKYILENPEEAKSINLKGICEKCNTTEPVVFAFCRKMQLNSFTELKTNIALSIGAQSVKPGKSKDIEVFDEGLLTLKNNSQILDYLKEHYDSRNRRAIAAGISCASVLPMLVSASRSNTAHQRGLAKR